MKASFEAALWLIVGLVAVFVSRNLLGLTGEPTLVAVLLLPMVLYMVLSGRISELTGPAA